mmetsp:Transcript_33720/g.84349  ORF Transcript_33720/g.84349 Transcript_33720/m.84349 type:complete len:127 (+) Transcript_33720:92-472(+)
MYSLQLYGTGNVCIIASSISPSSHGHSDHKRNKTYKQNISSAEAAKTKVETDAHQPATDPSIHGHGCVDLTVSFLGSLRAPIRVAAGPRRPTPPCASRRNANSCRSTARERTLARSPGAAAGTSSA